MLAHLLCVIYENEYNMDVEGMICKFADNSKPDGDVDCVKGNFRQ